jgi:DNA gyrase inhibitor GyrI/DNA-binding transcriptional ArsR family regulator
MEKFILESLEEIVALLKTIDHPQRLKLLTIMINEPRTFNQLLECTGLQKSALGNHLSILVDKNLVHKIGRGLYRPTTDGEAIIDHIAQSFLEIKVREQERLEKIRQLIGKYTTYGDEIMSEDEKKSKDMTDLDVRIVELEPMRVASARVIGKNPEEKAMAVLLPWAEKLGLLDNLEEHPMYGFNNPDPSPESEEYGYEFWIKISPEIQPEGDIKVKEFGGGLYAVTTTRLIIDPDLNIIPAWKRLAEWVKSSTKYNFAGHQWLEKHINPRAAPENMVLDLCCPIK